jgi:hypothetical protein
MREKHGTWYEQRREAEAELAEAQRLAEAATAPDRAIFRTPLKTDILDDVNVMLTEDFVYYSAELRREIRVPRGFVCDFASVPRVPGAYMLLGGRAKWESVLHDYLYRQLKLGRRVADNVFLEAMATPRTTLVDGKPTTWTQPRWVRNSMWLGVRAFGWTSYIAPINDQEGTVI